MREILFRGKDRDTNEWLYGSLIDCTTVDRALFCILEKQPKQQSASLPCNGRYPGLDSVLLPYVHPETVGQYTGLNYVKDGRKMFEGDVFRRGGALYVIKVSSYNGFRFVVEFADGSAQGAYTLAWTDAEYGEYIGNIHDNPELLRGIT